MIGKIINIDTKRQMYNSYFIKRERDNVYNNKMWNYQILCSMDSIEMVEFFFPSFHFVSMLK